MVGLIKSLVTNNYAGSISGTSGQRVLWGEERQSFLPDMEEEDEQNGNEATSK